MRIARQLQPILARHLARGKSVLLLGPRQTGKTTLVAELGADLAVSLASPSVRQRYERDPSALADEIGAIRAQAPRRPPPLVTIDEVQKVPALMDVGQDLIDRRQARFVFTGSSARKLRRGRDLNLLPGRVVVLRLDPLTLEERPASSLDEALLDGALPAIRLTKDAGDREADLRSYVETYLEEEVRQEALVRNVGAYGRFVELAAREAGRVANYSRISQDVGVSCVTIQSYYDILCDCLVAERVEPVTRSASRKKLTKASRFLLFDIGVARAAAREGRRLPLSRKGELFEQFVGIEAIRFCRLHAPDARLRFWRDPDGPEVDWVIEHPGGFLPIEVKLGDRPTERDTRHLHVFLEEYGGRQGLVVCSAPRPLQLTRMVTAVPWQDLPGALASALGD
jgi:predicted AAA+ superfamily ATPase